MGTDNTDIFAQLFTDEGFAEKLDSLDKPKFPNDCPECRYLGSYYWEPFDDGRPKGEGDDFEFQAEGKVWDMWFHEGGILTAIHGDHVGKTTVFELDERLRYFTSGTTDKAVNPLFMAYKKWVDLGRPYSL